MNETTIDILKKLKNDPTYAIQLYEELYSAKFLTLVRPDSERNLETMEFLTYPTVDEVAELPIFTSHDFVIDFPSMPTTMVEVEGEKLWPRLLEVVKTGSLEVAVDPGQLHGIRLNNQMILGMISMYAKT
jgi:hypothetical protein